jgi:hypothetical protein
MDADITYIMEYHTEYLTKVLGERVMEELSSYNWEDETLPLLCALKNKNFSSFANKPDVTISEITFNDIVDIIKNPGVYLEDVKSLQDYIKYDDADIRDNSKWFVPDVRALNKTYQFYGMILDIVREDEMSLLLLDAFYRQN